MADTRTAMLRLSAIVGERSLFENEDYRRLWLTRLLSHTPVNAIVYSMLILVVDTTGRAFFSSLFIAAYIAPTALLGTISGVLVDRLPKGIVLAATNLVRATLCVLLAMSIDSLFMIYLLAVLFAVGSQLAGPAEGAAMPAVVNREELTSANSLNNLGTLLSQVLGLMVLPVVFITTIGVEPLALVCAGLFVVAAFQAMLIQGIGGRLTRFTTTVDETREQFADAWQHLTQDHISYISVIIVVLTNTVGLVVVTLLPRYTTQVLGMSPEYAIFVVTPAALGIWLALRFVGQVSANLSPWRSIGGSFAALVVGVLLLSFVRPLGGVLEGVNLLGLFDPGPFGDGTARIIITGVLAAGLAFAFTYVNVVGRSIVNQRIPREMQGRVFAAQTVLTNLASIPPILLAGALADLLGVTPVLFLVAAFGALMAAYFSARSLATPVRATT
jgi:MFS family permease